MTVRGEPAAIAAMAQAVIRSQGIDAGRVVAAASSEIFAAVGIHSGVADLSVHPRGPDASREMLRFFSQQRRASSH